LDNCIRKLDNKVAIVTGGGTGIGRATAIAFARAGADVVVASRKLENLNKVASDVKALGQRSLAIAIDVRKAEDVNNLMQKTMQQFGKIDILVNNAGIALSKPLAEVSEEEWDTVLDINLKSVFLGCKYVIPHMIASGGGVILNMGSNLGVMGSSLSTVYGASKAGVLLLTRALALELRRHNIRVNAICPGLIDNEMGQEALKGYERYGVPSILKIITSRQGRLGKSEEVANAAVFLASEDASFITGQGLGVDGGFTAG